MNDGWNPYIIVIYKKVPIQLTRMYPPNWKRFFDDQLKAFSCTYMISPSQTANFAVDIGSSLAMIGPSWANPRGSESSMGQNPWGSAPVSDPARARQPQHAALRSGTAGLHNVEEA